MDEAMCTVPVSYLMHLQERGDAAPNSREYAAINISDTAMTAKSYEEMRDERDALAKQIDEFEFRAGCKLENIPVEALGEAQNAYVSQQAIDTLKADNERLVKQINSVTSEATDWRGKYMEAERKLGAGGAIGIEHSSAASRVEAKHAPWGFTKAGVPKRKPGGRGKGRRRAA